LRQRPEQKQLAALRPDIGSYPVSCAIGRSTPKSGINQPRDRLSGVESLRGERMAAGAAAVAVAEAMKASGVPVKLEPERFRKLWNRVKDPLIIIAGAGASGHHELMGALGVVGLAKIRSDAREDPKNPKFAVD